MTITITITDPAQLFGVEAAAAAATEAARAGNPTAPDVTPQAFLQANTENAARSWAAHFGSVKADIPLDRAMALGHAKAEWNAAAPEALAFEDESALAAKAAQFAMENKAAFETFMRKQ